MTGAAEVIIIGGGVIGCSIAYHLAKMGCGDVVILEKNYIGSGSTEKCAGGIRQQFSSEINIKLSMESVKFFKHFEDETGYPADFRQDGYLMLATTEDETEAFRRNVALQRNLGVEVHLLSPQEAKEIVPRLSVDDVRGATFCPTDGYADPYSVVQGFASAARRLRAKLIEDTEVVEIEVTEGRVRGVLTAEGKFEAPVVVNAAGPYASLIGKMAGLDLPVHPFRRHLFVTQPIFNQDSKSNYPLVIDFSNGFWFRREGPSLIFGMRNPEEQEGFDTTVDWEFLANSLGDAACHRLPFLADTGIARGQAGLHADTPDNNAILGPVPRIKGLYLACGFSGHGFMHSPAVGRIMAEFVLEGKPAITASSLSLDRFNSRAYHSEEYFI